MTVVLRCDGVGRNDLEDANRSTFSYTCSQISHEMINMHTVLYCTVCWTSP